VTEQAELATAAGDGAVPWRRSSRVLTYRGPSIAALLFPPTGVPALLSSLKAGRLAKEGRVEEARIAGERARDWCWYSVGIGLAAYFALFLVLLFTIRDGVLREVYFERDVITSWDAWRSLLKGFWINIQVALWAEAIVLVWALLVAVVRLLPGRECAPIRFVAAAYCDLFRGTPAVLVLLIINFGFQRARLPILENFSTTQYAILSLVLVYGAYVSEVYRAGIESIHWSQTAASRSLGLSHGQTLRYVVVPQAVRRVTLPLLNDFIGLQKDTALLSFIGVLEVLARARFINNSQATFTGYTMAAILFVVLTIPQTRFVDRLAKRHSIRMRAG
jgi:polar amino acid transport system permease protein